MAFKLATTGTIGLVATGFLDTDGITVVPISATNPLPGSPTGGDASVTDISTKLASNATIGLVALGYLGNDGKTIVPISAANPVPTSGGGSSGIEVTDGTHDFTGITKLLINGGTVSNPAAGEAEITVGSVDPYAWIALTFSSHSTTYGADFLVSDQTFTIADGDWLETEGALDSVGNGSSNSSQNGVGWLVGDSVGFVSFLDQNANRVLGQLTGGSLNIITYGSSGLQQGGGNWALTHSLSVQTSKATTGTCQCAYGGLGAGAQLGHMVAQEMAGTGRVVLWCNGVVPVPLWARARVIKAT